DPEPQQQGGYIAGESRTVRPIADGVTSLARPPRRNGAVGRPEVPKEERNLSGRKQEHGVWNALLLRALPEDPELGQPGIHSSGVPAIPLPAHEKLVPRTARA